MAIPKLEYALEHQEYWPTLLASFCYQNLLPNKLEIDESSHEHPTTYDALNNVYPEDSFSYSLDSTECITLEKGECTPTLFVTVGSSAKEALPAVGPSKSGKRMLQSGSDSRITTLAWRKKESSKEIAVGRLDGTVTLFEIPDDPSNSDTFYERNLSLEPICSVAFHNGSIIATDAHKKLYLLNRQTNVTLTIKNSNGLLLCPSLNDEQVLMVQQYNLNLSPDLPVNFFHHNLTLEQSHILLQCAQMKAQSLNKVMLDPTSLATLCEAIETYNFEPIVQKELHKRLQWALNKGKPKNSEGALSCTKESIAACLKKLQQCYTDLWKQLVPPQPSDGDIV